MIFGLLAGGEIYGLPGALVALPLLAAGRATWEFFDGRLVLEPFGREAVVPVGVPAETVVSAAPRDEAEAAADTEARQPTPPAAETETLAGRVRRGEPLLRRAASPAASAPTSRSSRSTSRCGPARRSRSSARTAPASRR